MGDSVLIDFQIKGWAMKNELQIKRDYTEIHYVGEAPNTSTSSSDSALASFCKANGCDMLTSDKKAYAPMLEEHEIGAVRISIYDMNEQSGQHVYRIRMV